MRVRDETLRELMDDPQCDEQALLRTVRRFTVVNRAVAGWGAIYRSRLRPYLRTRADAQREEPVRILDVGCGGGDVTRDLARRAHSDGFAVEICGIDPDPRCLSIATSQPPEPGVATVCVLRVTHGRQAWHGEDAAHPAVKRSAWRRRHRRDLQRMILPSGVIVTRSIARTESRMPARRLMRKPPTS